MGEEQLGTSDNWEDLFLDRFPSAQKFTGVKVSSFPGCPSWWIPKDGGSKGSAVWNCKRYSEFLRGLGYVILTSGERYGSPWWIVCTKEDYDKAEGVAVMNGEKVSERAEG